WYQANVWHAIMRDNQPIVASPDPAKVGWNSANGETTTGDLQSYDDVIRPATAELFARGAEYFPEPLDRLWILSGDLDGPAARRQRFRAADQKSVVDVVQESGKFSDEQIDLIRSYWAAGYIGNPDTGSSLMAKHWAALSNMELD